MPTAGGGNAPELGESLMRELARLSNRGLRHLSGKKLRAFGE
jgi:hypothetical protein